MPYPRGYFASAFSNSVLEHIPHVERVLEETARVLRPGAVFAFCVPNHRFNESLSISRGLENFVSLRWQNFTVLFLLTLPAIVIWIVLKFGSRAWKQPDL